MILLSYSNSSIIKRVLKFLALFYIFLFYYRPFLHMCNLVENLFSTLILGSVFKDYVVFYRDSPLFRVSVCLFVCLSVSQKDTV